MGKGEISDEKRHQRGGKFTESLLDSELIIKTLDIQPGQGIIDVGCGNGYMSKLFSEMVTQSGAVWALDSDEYFIRILGEETLGTNIEAVVGDISKPTPLSESSADLIYVAAVVHAMSPKQMPGFLQEVKRLLKPDALLAVVEIEKRETPFGPPLESRYSPEELKEIVPLIPLNTVQVGEHFYMQIFQNRENEENRSGV
jgi:ubiquinone/menaquinone biosynthesis C-methylase UbiE